MAPSPAGGDARVVELVLEGPDQVAPQASVSYRAGARYSNGVTLDVTGLAGWSTEPVRCQGCAAESSLAVAPGGMVTALAAGEGTVVATYEAQRAAKDVLALPAGAYRLIGQARSGDAPLSAVRISAVSETSLELSTITDAGGHYRVYGVGGITTVLATKDGFVPKQERLKVTSHVALDFDLVPPRSNGAASEPRLLTIRAAVDCPTTGEGALPPLARERRYLASITENGNQLYVKLSGAEFALAPAGYGGSGGDAFFGVRRPGGMAFLITGADSYYWDLYPYPDVVEQISSTQFLVIGGQAEVPNGTTTGWLNGSIVVLEGDLRPPGHGSWRVPQTGSECTSSRHSFSFAP